MKVQAYSYGRETYSFRGYFSKGTCQMINDTLTGREGVKIDAMRVFRQTKRPSLIGGGLSWLNIRLGARISCHKHYSTEKEGTHTPKDHTATPATGAATTSPMPGRGRWAQGRRVHPCQVSRYYPIGVCANGRPPRPSPLFCDF